MALILQKKEVVRRMSDCFNSNTNGSQIEKDLADPVQVAKDVERSLYYYPQGKKKSVVNWNKNNKEKLFGRCDTYI